MKNKTIRSGAALLALLTVLCACGGREEAADVVDGPWQDVVAAAKNEGHINLYSAGPPIQNERLVAAFNREYPDIQVTVTRGAGELRR